MSYRIEGTQLISLNPKNEQEVDRLAVSRPEQIEATVAAAKKAQPAWAALAVSDRVAAVRAGLEQIQSEKAAISRRITDEMGKPIASAEGELDWAVEEMLTLVLPNAEPAMAVSSSTEGEVTTELHRVPAGVVGVIAPWNFPISTYLASVIPALVTGNAVVVKASENTPLVGHDLVNALSRHLPEGVLGEVIGDGEQGAQLCRSPLDMVAFTGSIATGQKIYASGTDAIRPVMLELGGKDPLIILNGSDVDAAVKYAVSRSLGNTGQVCTSVERVFVEEPLYDEVVAAVQAKVAKFSYGDPAEPSTRMGPMANGKQRQIVLDQLADARAKGAKVSGGEPGDGPGFFIAPAVVSDCPDDALIFTEETFGPVVAIAKVASPDEALEKANSLPYGLGATVFGPDASSLKDYAKKIESGMVGINGRNPVPGSPFLGHKQSGLGFVDGVEGMRSFTRLRAITIHN